MKILILNGIPKDNKYQEYEKTLEKSISNNKLHNIDYFRLRDMNINYCNGCFGCWIKTPGKCVIKDDHNQILSRMSYVDLVLYVSPVILGYESSILKTCKDRSIATALPYITFFKGEQHHLQRYEKTPDTAVLMITDEDTIEEDINLIKATYHRNAYNFRNSKVKSFNTVDSSRGVEDVINSL